MSSSSAPRPGKAKPSTKAPPNAWGARPQIEKGPPPGLQATSLHLTCRDEKTKNTFRALFLLSRDEMQASQTPIIARLTNGAELEGTFWGHDPDSQKIIMRVGSILKPGSPAGDYTEGKVYQIMPGELESYWTTTSIKDIRLAEAGGGHGGSGGGAGFATDVDISARRGGSGKDRELQRLGDSWLTGSNGSQGGGGGGRKQRGGDLTGDASEWDQFAANKRFGVSANFDENLYTTPKPALSTEKEAEAARIAREIEGETSRNMHVAEERGHAIQTDMDEEDRFSGVLKNHPANRDQAWRSGSGGNDSGGGGGGNRKKGGGGGEGAPQSRPSASTPPLTGGSGGTRYVPPHLRSSSGQQAPPSSVPPQVTAQPTPSVVEQQHPPTPPPSSAPESPAKPTPEKSNVPPPPPPTPVDKKDKETVVPTPASSAPGTPSSTAGSEKTPSLPSLSGAKKLSAAAKAFVPGVARFTAPHPPPVPPVQQQPPPPPPPPQQHQQPPQQPSHIQPVMTVPGSPVMPRAPYPYHTQQYEQMGPPAPPTQGGGGGSGVENYYPQPMMQGGGGGGGRPVNSGHYATMPPHTGAGGLMPPQYMTAPPPVGHHPRGGPMSAPPPPTAQQSYATGPLPVNHQSVYLTQGPGGASPQMMYGQQMYGQPVNLQQGRYSPAMMGTRGPGGMASGRGQPPSIGAPHYMTQAGGMIGGGQGGGGQLVPRGYGGGGLEIGPDGMPLGEGIMGRGRGQRTPKGDRGRGKGGFVGRGGGPLSGGRGYIPGGGRYPPTGGYNSANSSPLMHGTVPPISPTSLGGMSGPHSAMASPLTTPADPSAYNG